jgi:site-specific DNA recombinase
MRVNIIQPKPKVKAVKRRVCAYARVSTEHDKQGESLENQITYYEQLIQSNPEYEFVGVFADYGISGTTEQRPEFQRMLELAKAGQIDLIITKSISRFARNTTILLETVRELKLKGIEVKFEKENISTLSGDGELMLTVLASFAQEESKNISDNIKWRIRNDFKNGKIMINEKRFLGYDKDKNGNLVINESEASIVRKIFTLYLSGKSSGEIAKILTKEGIKTVTGKDKWRSSSVNYILKNEKYKGDVLNQKTYKPTHLKGNTVMNNRQVDQYYIKEHHELIITESMWEKVQEIMEAHRRKKKIEKSHKYQKRYPYSGLLYCGKCGAKLKRRVWNSKLPSKKVMWQCSTYINEGKDHCEGISISEEILNKAAIKGETVIKEEKKNGKKYYSYTSKGEYDKSSRKARTTTKTDGRILQGVNGSSRTVIKL